MNANFSDDPLRLLLRRLAAHLPFAPRSVEKALADLPREDFLAPLRLRIETLLRQARETQLAQPQGTACLFPTVTEGAPVGGALFYAVAQLFRPPGACPIGDAFPEETEMLRLLGGAFSGSLSLLPSPIHAETSLLTLVGGSAGGAFAVAAEALRRGVSVPEDVAVSARLAAGPDGSLHLRSVSGLAEKIALLEEEKPGCRFFFVPPPGKQLRSTRIRLQPIPAGAIEVLYEALLPRRHVPTRTRIYDRLREAERAFRDQDYPLARQHFRELLPMLDALGYEEAEPRRWRFWSLTALGAIALHAGETEEAERLFEEAKDLGQDGLHQEKDELLLYVAGLYLDRLSPSEASAHLLPLTDLWRQRMRLDPAGDDRRRVWIGCLGGMRRLHLLRGEPERAHVIQEELLAWSPEPERARSLGDLGECLRRMRRVKDAELAFREARKHLDAVYLPTYRLQTEAFLTFYEARLSLDRGRCPDLEAIGELVPRLPAQSAAGWRLRQVALLGRLLEGDESAREALIRSARSARSDFARWQQGLGLLRALELRPADGVLREAIRGHFEELTKMAARFGPIERAHRGLLESLYHREDPLPFAQSLLHHSPY